MDKTAFGHSFNETINLAAAALEKVAMDADTKVGIGSVLGVGGLTAAYQAPKGKKFAAGASSLAGAAVGGPAGLIAGILAGKLLSRGLNVVSKGKLAGAILSPTVALAGSVYGVAKGGKEGYKYAVS